MVFKRKPILTLSAAMARSPPIGNETAGMLASARRIVLRSNFMKFLPDGRFGRPLPPLLDEIMVAARDALRQPPSTGPQNPLMGRIRPSEVVSPLESPPETPPEIPPEQRPAHAREPLFLLPGALTAYV